MLSIVDTSSLELEYDIMEVAVASISMGVTGSYESDSVQVCQKDVISHHQFRQRSPDPSELMYIGLSYTLLFIAFFFGPLYQ